ncbi:hypothetical protein [uncultured Parabacteroides sp.]|uniref:hypothetical protein n=1 Tax=uncultured Parabacteroides sp. TaxID=512312 RepID=UPI0025D82AA3|nr:hypothetical protein [uncultured Parabacteroides sp.]
MTAIELEARKALLVKEILTDINSEEMIEKLSHYLKRIKKQLAEKEDTAPCQYTVNELKDILAKRQKESHYYTQEEVKEIKI